MRAGKILYFGKDIILPEDKVGVEYFFKLFQNIAIFFAEMFYQAFAVLEHSLELGLEQGL